MKLSQQSQTIIESVLRKAVSRYACGCGVTTLSDIHIQPNCESGDLYIYDDDEMELAKETIEEWTNYQGDDFYLMVEKILKSILNRLNEEGEFEKLTLLKPYSFVLVDQDKETVAELLLVDDETLLVDDELLKGLDEELDTFLKNLLEK